MRDLSVESTRGPCDRDCFVTGLFPEQFGDLTRRLVEVGCDDDMSVVCLHRRCQCREQEAEGSRYDSDLHNHLRFAERLTHVLHDQIYRRRRQ